MDINAVLLSPVRYRRPAGDTYMVFGSGPPTGPIPFDLAANLLRICFVKENPNQSRYSLPALETVHDIIWHTRYNGQIYYMASRALAALGVAIVRECLTGGEYVDEILAQYPDHVVELYSVYFNSWWRGDRPVVTIARHLSDAQAHQLMDHFIPRTATAYDVCIMDQLRRWGGHDAYCSVVARLAYI